VVAKARKADGETPAHTDVRQDARQPDARAALELTVLNRQQHDARERATFMRMSAQETRAYEDRARRISLLLLQRALNKRDAEAIPIPTRGDQGQFSESCLAHTSVKLHKAGPNQGHATPERRT
jgi:hypothetical protein